MKQTVHLYYWSLVTAVFLNDFNALYQSVGVVLCPENVMKC